MVLKTQHRKTRTPMGRGAPAKLSVWLLFLSSQAGKSSMQTVRRHSPGFGVLSRQFLLLLSFPHQLSPGVPSATSLGLSPAALFPNPELPLHLPRPGAQTKGTALNFPSFSLFEHPELIPAAGVLLFYFIFFPFAEIPWGICREMETCARRRGTEGWAASSSHLAWSLLPALREESHSTSDKGS